MQSTKLTDEEKKEEKPTVDTKPEEKEVEKEQVPVVKKVTVHDNMEFKAKPRTRAQVLEMMKRIRPSETEVINCDGPQVDGCTIDLPAKVADLKVEPEKKEEKEVKKEIAEPVDQALVEQWKWEDRPKEDDSAKVEEIEEKVMVKSADFKSDQYTSSSI